MSSEAASGQSPLEPDTEGSTDSNREPATIIRGPDGTARGVAVVLTADDLRKLGLSLTDVDEVVPRVYSGALLIEPVN